MNPHGLAVKAVLTVARLAIAMNNFGFHEGE